MGVTRDRVRAVKAVRGIVLVDGGVKWPIEFEEMMADLGYTPLPIEDLSLAPGLLRGGTVIALLIGDRSLSLKDLIILRECRSVAPSVPLVAVTTATSQPGLKRALESGATSFLAWPASKKVLEGVLSPRPASSEAMESATRAITPKRA